MICLYLRWRWGSKSHDLNRRMLWSSGLLWWLHASQKSYASRLLLAYYGKGLLWKGARQSYELTGIFFLFLFFNFAPLAFAIRSDITGMACFGLQIGRQLLIQYSRSIDWGYMKYTNSVFIHSICCKQFGQKERLNYWNGTLSTE